MFSMLQIKAHSNSKLVFSFFFFFKDSFFCFGGSESRALPMLCALILGWSLLTQS